MKILVISATFPPVSSGGADYALRLCQNIAKRGHDVHVLTSKIDNVVQDESITVHSTIHRWTWSELVRILEVVKSVKPDVVNLHFGGFLYNDHPMITFLPTILRFIDPKIRFVTHIEAPIGCRVYLWPRTIRVTHRIVCELFRSQDVAYAYGTLLRDSDKIIVLSEEHGNELCQIYSRLKAKLALIPPPPLMPIVNLSIEQAKKKLSLNSSFILVYLGYLYPGKGIETLLESFKLAAQKNDDIKLIVVGGSPEMLLKNVGRDAYAQEMRDLADKLGIANKITWTGNFDFDSEVPSLYLRAADFGVMPWDWGVHLNNSSFGAAACHGLPIVTTSSPTSEDVFVDRENVYLCPPKDPAAVAEAIGQLIADKALCEKLSQGALTLSSQWFSWDRAIDKTLALFSDS
ncbi:MAG: glycosyltransferase family 4 protein [Candidatus Obscuribacterales bacterium]|nr:glycosyltransferase family 4 protein [Candidatus Obscuribacterales bacterium]